MPSEVLNDILTIVWTTLLAGVGGLVLGKTYKYIKDQWTSYKCLSAIPQPPESVPIFGVAFRLLSGCPWEIMHAWLMKISPVMFLKIFNIHMVLVGNSEGLRRVWQTGQRHFGKDLELSFKPFMGILGTGLVTANGHAWMTQRKAMQHVLRFDLQDAVATIAYQATKRLCERIREHQKDNKPIEMEEEFRRLTLQIIGEAFLSLPPEESDRVFPDLYLPIMSEGHRRSLRPWRMYVPTPAWFKQRSLLRQLNAYLVQLLKKRWDEKLSQKGSYNDLLEQRLDGILARGEVWNAALQEHLCYEFKTFLLAGHETSAAMLTWTLFELSQHPEKLEKVVEEGKGLLDDSSKIREGGESQQYALCCLKESLRKYSVVPVVTRRADRDEEIEGYRIPKGTYVACYISAVHMKEWANPESWRPERFMPEDEYDSFPESIRPFKFVPFTAGPRNCLGQNFALLEARIVLNTLLQEFRFTPLDTNPKPNDKMIPIGPKYGMHMRSSRAV